MMSKDIEAFEKGDCMVYRVTGRFVEDESHQALLRQVEHATERDFKKFLVDLEGLEYVNSSGINLLVKMVKHLNQHKAQLVFTSVPDKVRELLTIIKLNAVLDIHPSMDDGIQSLN